MSLNNVLVKVKANRHWHLNEFTMFILEVSITNAAGRKTGLLHTTKFKRF